MSGLSYQDLPRETWVEVDRSRLERNLRIWRSRVGGAATLVVVKANAYGHGLERVGPIFEKAGADFLGVANVAEGAILRSVGVSIPILVMGYVSDEEVQVAINSDLDIFFWTKEQLGSYAAAAHARKKLLRLHLKIDTGMGRLGCAPTLATELAEAAKGIGSVEIVGLASHFSEADGKSVEPAARQLGIFQSTLDDLERLSLRPPIAHIANTPGAMRLASARFDMCRLGIGAYGLKPEPAISLPDGVEPALQWLARCAPPRTFGPGVRLSYGGEYETRSTEVVAVLPLGYADGFHRHPGNVNSVLVNGGVRPILGRVCMDQCLVRLHEPDEAKAKVTILGRNGDAEISADDLAARWGTNNYDVVCGISPRVPRVYI